MIIVYFLAKLVQIILLLLCLAILSVGLYEFAMGIWYFVRGQTVEGRVITVHAADRPKTSSHARPATPEMLFAFRSSPTISRLTGRRNTRSSRWCPAAT